MPTATSTPDIRHPKTLVKADRILVASGMIRDPASSVVSIDGDLRLASGTTLKLKKYPVLRPLYSGKKKRQWAFFFSLEQEGDKFPEGIYRLTITANYAKWTPAQSEVLFDLKNKHRPVVNPIIEWPEDKDMIDSSCFITYGSYSDVIPTSATISDETATSNADISTHEITFDNNVWCIFFPDFSAQAGDNFTLTVYPGLDTRKHLES